MDVIRGFGVGGSGWLRVSSGEVSSVEGERWNMLRRGVMLFGRNVMS